MPRIRSLKGLEILDSRGTPTVRATCTLASGAVANASVPSGASTGAAEARELRDADATRYGGRGCRKAAGRVSGDIHNAFAGRDFESQDALDQALISLDGTPNKEQLGANAILSVSIAFARAHAIELGLPLYEHFARLLGQPIRALPRITVNLFSGGKHAGGQVPIQDVLIVPVAAPTIDASLVQVHAVYQAAVDLIARKYGMRWLTADEGGLAPPARNAEDLLNHAVEAIEKAGLKPGTDILLGLDVAASHFYHDGEYHLGSDRLSSNGMIDRLRKWSKQFPIVSIEDGLAEDDWEHWTLLTRALGEKMLILGDDLLCTNPERIRRAIAARACNALLLKVNQIGTLTEALESYRLARSAGWHVTMSARSGETEDNWFSDLAVGWSGDQTKIGSVTQSERLAKYNRLLEIEADRSDA